MVLKKIWRHRTAFLFALVMLCISTGCSSGVGGEDYRDDLVEPGVLTIGTSGNYAPYSLMEGGTPGGYSVEECRELAERLGLEARVKVLDFNALFTGLQSGQLDVACSSITQTSVRKAARGFHLSTPTEVDPTTLLTLDSNGASKVRDADGAKLGGVSGGAQPEIIRSYLGGGQDMTTFPGLAEAVLALEQGRVEYVAVGRLVGTYFASQNPRLRVVPDVVNPVPGGIAIAPRPALREAVDDNLQQMLADGAIADLQQRWFTTTGLPEDYPGATDKTKVPDSAFWTPVTSNWAVIWKGTLLTLGLSLLALALATLLGVPAGIARDQGPRWLRVVIGTFSWVMRGLPALVLLFLVYYGLPTIGWSFSAFWAAVLALSVQATGYVLEIVRGGLRAVPSRQYDAIRALGLPRLRGWRQVILPQAVPAMLPPYFSNSIQLLKASSLASIITLQELTGVTNNLIGSTYASVQLIVTAAVIYVLVATLLVVVQAVVERSLPLVRARRRATRAPQILKEVVA